MNVDQTLYCGKCGSIVDKMPERPIDEDPEFLEKSMKARARANAIDYFFSGDLGDAFPRTTASDPDLRGDTLSRFEGAIGSEAPRFLTQNKGGKVELSFAKAFVLFLVSTIALGALIYYGLYRDFGLLSLFIISFSALLFIIVPIIIKRNRGEQETWKRKKHKRMDAEGSLRRGMQ